MKLVYTVLLLCVSITLTFGQSSEAGAPKTDAAKKAISAYIEDLHKSGGFNGTILIAEKGKPIYQKAFGMAVEETKTPNNIDTVFELASVSKQFTAMGIVQLQKQGKLSYDDPLGKHIPELDFYEGITIRHLLIHTAGIPDYMGLLEKNWNKTKIADNEDVIKEYARSKPSPLFKPNERFSYSNTGYLLLGTIIERVSGKSFEDYLRQTIYQPLGMKNTFTYRRRYKPQKVKNYAEGYIYSKETNSMILPDSLGKEYFTYFLDGIVGDGMVSSNLKDLLKWDRALYSDKLVTAEDKALIFASYKLDNGRETNYGFGWQISDNKLYGKLTSHSGSWAGYLTYIDRHMDNDITIIFLQNKATPLTRNPIGNLRKILYNIPINTPIELSADELKKFAGKYANEAGTEREVLFEDGELKVEMNPEVKLKLVPLSKTRFLLSGFSPEVYYEFFLNKDGNVEKYRTSQPELGTSSEAVRIKK